MTGRDDWCDRCADERAIEADDAVEDVGSSVMSIVEAAERRARNVLWLEYLLRIDERGETA